MSCRLTNLTGIKIDKNIDITGFLIVHGRSTFSLGPPMTDERYGFSGLGFILHFSSVEAFGNTGHCMYIDTSDTSPENHFAFKIHHERWI